MSVSQCFAIQKISFCSLLTFKLWQQTQSSHPQFLLQDEATRETMAMVRQVVHRTGTDTDTFCKWLMAQKVEVEGPLSGICHWFTHPEKSLHRPRFHQQHHRVTPEYAGDYEESGLVRRTSLGAHLHHSTSISIIMILATVLFLLIITAFVTCIIRKKRRPQVWIWIWMNW